jgi:hypothetical protein
MKANILTILLLLIFMNPIKTELRKCFLEQLGLTPMPKKTPLNPVYTPIRKFNEYERYRPDQQYRCAMLARMGAVVFSYEMFAYGESLLQVEKADHKTALEGVLSNYLMF